MTLIEKAKQFAHDAHDNAGNKRKYTLEPYWVHTDEVAEIVAAAGGDEFMVAAAHLHDVIEDANITVVELRDEFPLRVVTMVIDLTDTFTPEQYPLWNRAKRKEFEAQRLSRIHPDSQTIKVADFLSNTKSIVEHDAGFAKTYLREKARVLAGLGAANFGLLIRAEKQLQESLDKLGLMV